MHGKLLNGLRCLPLSTPLNHFLSKKSKIKCKKIIRWGRPTRYSVTELELEKKPKQRIFKNCIGAPKNIFGAA